MRCLTHLPPSEYRVLRNATPQTFKPKVLFDQMYDVIHFIYDEREVLIIVGVLSHVSKFEFSLNGIVAPSHDCLTNMGFSSFPLWRATKPQLKNKYDAKFKNMTMGRFIETRVNFADPKPKGSLDRGESM